MIELRLGLRGLVMCNFLMWIGARLFDHIGGLFERDLCKATTFVWQPLLADVRARLTRWVTLT